MKDQSHSTPADCCPVSPAWPGPEMFKNSWKFDFDDDVSTFPMQALNYDIVKHRTGHAVGHRGLSG